MIELARFMNVDKAIEILSKRAKAEGKLGLNTRSTKFAIAFIERQPEADAVEVKHGEWLEDKHYEGDYKCSICGNYAKEDYKGTNSIKNKYCSECGARMDGKQVTE